MLDAPPPRLAGGRVSQNKRPEPLWPALLVVLIAAQAGCMVAGSRPTNLVAGVIGLFAAVVLLGLSRAREAQRRADGRFTDWKIESATLMNSLTLASWAIGVLNVYFVAKDFTR